MKKLFILISIAATLGGHSFAQTLSWAHGFGAVSNDEGFGVAYDDSGNVYSTGNFTGTVDFDPGSGTYNLTSVGSGNMYVLKLNAVGNFVWAKSFGKATSAATGSSSGGCIQIDTAGNVVVGGYFSGTVDFDPGSGALNIAAVGSADACIVKLSAAGSLVWAKTFGGTASDVVAALTIDKANNIVSTGHFASTVDFNPGAGVYNLTSFGGDDIFVIKLDAVGNLVWANQMGANSSDWGYALCTDEVDNVYATGYFMGNADFDPGSGVFNLTTSVSYREVFVTKLSAAGGFIWAKQMGSYTGEDLGQGIRVDAAHNVYTTGSYQGNADFDPGTASYLLPSVSGTFDMFISKLDSAGNFIWAKQIGAGAGSEGGYAIDLDTFGNVYTTGSFTGTVDFDPGAGTYNLTSASATQYDMFISKLTSAGTFISAAGMGGIASDVSNSLHVAADGTIYIGGGFEDTVDFDPGSTVYNVHAASNVLDIFVAKYTQCMPVTPSITVTAHPGIIISVGQPDTFTTTTTGGGSGPHYQWYVNGVAITGATSATYISDSLHNNDSVSCTVLSSDTCATSPEVRSNILVIQIKNSVATLSYAHNVVLYPNPNQGVFTIKAVGLETNTTAGFTVTDVLGKTVYSGSAPVQNGQLNAAVQLENNLANGMYLLHLESGNERQVLKFTVQH